MPFNTDTARAGGKKGGGKRWKDKAPDTVRSKQLKVSVTEAEYNAIIEKAAALGLSNAEFIVRAARAYRGARKG